MAFYGFNENLEKEKIITLTSAPASVASQSSTNVVWQYSDLEEAGIDYSHLEKYAVLDFSIGNGNPITAYTQGESINSLGIEWSYVQISLGTYGTIAAACKNGSGAAITVSFRIRLIKVE